MITVIAVIEVAAGRRDAFLSEFHKVVPLVHAENGCIEYAPTVDAQTDLEVQRPMGVDVVTVVEKWESVAALKAHLSAPHMADYRKRVKDLVRGAKIHILEP